jgi:hypothetical protein
LLYMIQASSSRSYRCPSFSSGWCSNLRFWGWRSSSWLQMLMCICSSHALMWQGNCQQKQSHKWAFSERSRVLVVTAWEHSMMPL